MKTAFLWMVLAMALMVVVGSSQAQEILYPENETPDCIADWDPFCPRGDGSGGGGETSFTCEYCKFTKEFTTKCASVPVGELGMTECTDSDDGLSCEVSGVTCGSV